LARILALEPYLGGSHQAFLEGWARHSRHDFEIRGLPARHWKWRMRHSAWTLARQLQQDPVDADLLFCSDMLALAEFRGLSSPPWSRLPCVLYFHENQLTYPDPHARERDHHFGITNLTSALAADAVWFNSDFHCQALLGAWRNLLQRMPDHRSPEEIQRLAARARVEPPGIDPLMPPTRRAPGPTRLLWAARFEQDKDPDLLFRALRRLRELDRAFRLRLLAKVPVSAAGAAEQLRQEFQDHVDVWGYLDSRAEYREVLRSSDLVVSTARHEFFGISVVEAVAAGAVPVVPAALAYPEVLGERIGVPAECFYDGTESGLVQCLGHWLARVEEDRLPALGSVQPLFWPQRAVELDRAIDEVLKETPG
jgi:glycosyltransferase involved in cell wall biosynthesis